MALIDENLCFPTELCLIGGAACVISGQPGRTSMCLEVLSKKSRFVLSDLKRAVEAVGLDFDPQEKGKLPCVKLVSEGVQVGTFRKTVTLVKKGRLRLIAPPPQNLIASTLVQVTPENIEDAAYLLSTFKIGSAAVASVIKNFPDPARVSAEKNMIYINVLSGSRKKSPPDQVKPAMTTSEFGKKKRGSERLGSKEQETDAIHLLLNYDAFLAAVGNKDWDRVLNVLKYAKQDISSELAQTDPALYKNLRDAVTRLHIQGWIPKSLRGLEKMVCGSE